MTLRLISQVVLHPRGRPLEAALDLSAAIAARRRERLIAVVRAATELTASQRRRLAEALAASYGHEVHLNVVIDPSVVGGMSVQIGDELIDGSVGQPAGRACGASWRADSYADTNRRGKT